VRWGVRAWLRRGGRGRVDLVEAMGGEMWGWGSDTKCGRDAWNEELGTSVTGCLQGVF